MGMSGGADCSTTQSTLRCARISSAAWPLAASVSAELVPADILGEPLGGRRVGADQDQVFHGLADELANRIQKLVERLAALDRLVEHGERSVAGSAVVGRLGRHDADGDVPGGHVVLEPVDDAPAVDIGQADIQGDRVGLVLARHRQRGGPERRDQSLEAFLAGGLEQQPGERQVVFHDQEQRIAGLQAVAVVADLVDELGRFEDHGVCVCRGDEPRARRSRRARRRPGAGSFAGRSSAAGRV